MSPEHRARIVDIHHVYPEDGSRSYYKRNVTRSETASTEEHVARARAIDAAGKAGATDLPGRHVGVIIEDPKYPATKRFVNIPKDPWGGIKVVNVVTDNVASGLATMMLQEHIDNGGTTEIPSLGITLTREHLASSFHLSKQEGSSHS